MIKYIEISNFHSINTEQVLDFEIGLTADSKFKAQPVLGFAGSNASGKTNTLKAIYFVSWFISKSLANLQTKGSLPIETFITHHNLPTTINLLFKIETKDYFYRLEILNKKIVEERLIFVINGDGDEKIIFTRSANDNVTFGKGVKKLAVELIDDLPENCSFITFAAKFKTQTYAIDIKEYFDTYFSNIDLVNNQMTEIVLEERLLEGYKAQIKRILKYADVGILDYENIDDDDKTINFLTSFVADEDVNDETKMFVVNQVQNNNFRLKKLVFHHKINNENVKMDKKNQSLGTLHLLGLLVHILKKLENGGVLIMDEIELKLHPDVICFILNLFNSPYENPKNAQLIFSFHNSQFMQNLKPEQLWFAQKNEMGETELYPAIAFDFIEKIKEEEGVVDLERYYRAGRFQAKPAISYISQTTL